MSCTTHHLCFYCDKNVSISGIRNTSVISFGSYNGLAFMHADTGTGQMRFALSFSNVFFCLLFTCKVAFSSFMFE